MTVFSDAAADAGGEGEVDGLGVFAARAGGFVESGEVGVVGEENFAVEQIFYLGEEVDFVPVEIAELERTRIWFNFDDAWDGDGDGFDAATAGGVWHEGLEVF